MPDECATAAARSARRRPGPGRAGRRRGPRPRRGARGHDLRAARRPGPGAAPPAALHDVRAHAPERPDRRRGDRPDGRAVHALLAQSPPPAAGRLRPGLRDHGFPALAVVVPEGRRTHPHRQPVPPQLHPGHRGRARLPGPAGAGPTRPVAPARRDLRGPRVRTSADRPERAREGTRAARPGDARRGVPPGQPDRRAGRGAPGGRPRRRDQEGRGDHPAAGCGDPRRAAPHGQRAARLRQPPPPSSPPSRPSPICGGWWTAAASTRS